MQSFCSSSALKICTKAFLLVRFIRDVAGYDDPIRKLHHRWKKIKTKSVCVSVEWISHPVAIYKHIDKLPFNLCENREKYASNNIDVAQLNFRLRKLGDVY